MNFFELAMAVNLGVRLSEKPRRNNNVVLNKEYCMKRFDVNILSDDPFIAMEQMDLIDAGKMDEAIALKNKK